MSIYLARLKQLENEKNSSYVSNTEPPKPAKAPSDPFGGSHQANIKKNYFDQNVITCANDPIFSSPSNGNSIKADEHNLDISTAGGLLPERVQQLKQSKRETLTELQREAQQQEIKRGARQEKVLAMLRENPEVPRAIYADAETDPHNVILTIAVRNCATCEMLVPKAKYDPWRLLELIEQHGQPIH